MKRLMATGVIVVLLQSPASGQMSFTDSLQTFVPAGYELLTLETGDLDADGRTDALLAVRPIGEDTLEADPMPPRRLMVLLRQQDGSFRIAATSDSALYPFGYDANFRDCLTGLQTEKGSFTIEHYGGFATRWGRSTTFRYEPASGNWLLAKDEHTSFAAMHHEDSERTDIFYPYDFGRVDFTQFNIYKGWKHRHRSSKQHR